MLSSSFRYHSTSSCSSGSCTPNTCSSSSDSQKKKPSFGRKALAGVGRIIMTASVKGGVGKSTIALNTALSLSKAGARVGLFDADIYGPSVPTISSTLKESLVADEKGNFIPIESNGIHTVSLGYAADPKSALLWKGPLISQLISELLHQAIWPELDYLILDTPPGTGDVHMAISSSIPVDGALIVTSPQQVVHSDVIRNIEMFKTLKIPILGLIQNFDGFICSKCNTNSKIFPGNSADQLKTKFNLDLLGSLPIDPEVSKSCDSGNPFILNNPNSEYTKIFMDIANKIITKLPKTQPKYPAKTL